MVQKDQFEVHLAAGNVRRLYRNQDGRVYYRRPDTNEHVTLKSNQHVYFVGDDSASDSSVNKSDFSFFDSQSETEDTDSSSVSSSSSSGDELERRRYEEERERKRRREEQKRQRDAAEIEEKRLQKEIRRQQREIRNVMQPLRDILQNLQETGAKLQEYKTIIEQRLVDVVDDLPVATRGRVYVIGPDPDFLSRFQAQYGASGKWPFKIGKSTKPDRRKQELQTGNWETLKVFAESLHYFDDAFEQEKRVHEALEQAGITRIRHSIRDGAEPAGAGGAGGSSIMAGSSEWFIFSSAQPWKQEPMRSVLEWRDT